MSASSLAAACASIANGGYEARRAGDFARAGYDVLDTLVLDTKHRVLLAKTAVTEAIAAGESILGLPDAITLRPGSVRHHHGRLDLAEVVFADIAGPAT